MAEVLQGSAEVFSTSWYTIVVSKWASLLPSEHVVNLRWPRNTY
jgi:hypothetical protein